MKRPNIPHARSLRREQTDAERMLWRQLRGRHLLGRKFRRQFPLGHFIVDFVCIDARLVVELDGGQHVDRAAHDSQRTAWLEDAGYRVLRFWNDDVLLRMDQVIEQIVAALDEVSVYGDFLAAEADRHKALTLLHLDSTSPHPGPLPKGEREKGMGDLQCSTPSPLWGEGWGEGQSAPNAAESAPSESKS